MDTAIPDDRLRLIFTCCHPALAPEARVALTLRTLGGLQTPEIARAFLVSESAMQQRLVRAKGKIRDARIPYRGAARPRAARPAGVGARRALPDLQRGLRRHLGRVAGAPRAVRRGDPPDARAARPDARRARGARAAGAHAAPGLAARRPHRGRRPAGAARGAGPLALGPRRDRGGARAGRPRRSRGLRAPGRDRRGARARRRPGGDGLAADRRALRAARRDEPRRRSSSSTAPWRLRWPRARRAAWS